MPDEAYGSPSQIAINLENLNTSESIEAMVSIEQMTYDLTLASLYIDFHCFFLTCFFFRTRYTLMSQSNFTIVRKPFFSLPAVKLNFVLNR